MNKNLDWELKDYLGKKSCPICKKRIDKKLTLLTNRNVDKWGYYWYFIKKNYLLYNIVIINNSMARKRKKYSCEYCRLLQEYIIYYRREDRTKLWELLGSQEYIHRNSLPARLRNLINTVNDWEPHFIVGWGDLYYSKILDIYIIGHVLHLDKFNKLNSCCPIYITRCKRIDKLEKIIDKIYT